MKLIFSATLSTSNVTDRFFIYQRILEGSFLLMQLQVKVSELKVCCVLCWSWKLRSSDDIKTEQECFKVRFTGELFADYDQYIDALFAYQVGPEHGSIPFSTNAELGCAARLWVCDLRGIRHQQRHA